MNFTWHGETYPEPVPLGLLGGIRVVIRTMIIVVIFGLGLALTLVLRVFEAPFRTARRPLTAPITRYVFRATLWVIGLRLKVQGCPMPQGGAVVANHSSWLDIMVLHAAQTVVFVSKAEVARWPVIGALARLNDTVFIRRDRREARTQAELFQTRMESGQRLLFFPEGTSTDGMRVLPFKSSLFEAFFTDKLRPAAHIQPISVIYDAPRGAVDLRFYGWWGDMDMAPHALKVLGAMQHGQVRVLFHAPLAVAAYEDRKALSAALEAQVRAGMPEGRRAVH